MIIGVCNSEILNQFVDSDMQYSRVLALFYEVFLPFSLPPLASLKKFSIHLYTCTHYFGLLYCVLYLKYISIIL